MSSSKNEKKDSRVLKEMVDSYSEIRKEDSGVRFKTVFAVDENSGARIKEKSASEKKDK